MKIYKKNSLFLWRNYTSLTFDVPDLKIGKLSKAIRNKVRLIWSQLRFFTLIRSFNNHQIIKPSPLLLFDFEWFQFTESDLKCPDTALPLIVTFYVDWLWCHTPQTISKRDFCCLLRLSWFFFDRLKNNPD